MRKFFISVLFFIVQTFFIPVQADSECVLTEWKIKEIDSYGSTNPTLIVQGISNCEEGLVSMRFYNNENIWIGNGVSPMFGYIFEIRLRSEDLDSDGWPPVDMKYHIDEF